MEDPIVEIMSLCNLVRQTAYQIHVDLGHGYFEKIYENALAHRLSTSGLQVQQQHSVCVHDIDGTVLGNYCLDLLIENRLLIEIKATNALITEHQAQVLAYLKSTRLRHALLINFGSYRFEIRKFISPFAERPGIST